MKLKDADAWLAFFKKLVQNLSAIAVWAAFVILWVLGAWGVHAISRLSGLGGQWGAVRMAAQCLGASSELFFALLLPLAGIVGEAFDRIDMRDEYGHGWGQASGHYSGNPKQDGSWVVGLVLGAIVAFLDIARFTGPFLTFVPSWFADLVSGWWFIFDSSMAFLTTIFALCIVYFGLAEMWKSAVNLEGEAWIQGERRSIERAAKGSVSNKRINLRI